MSTFLVSYDLKTPGQKYGPLIEGIKGIGGYCHVLASTWMVSASYATAQSIYDALRPLIDDSDRLFVNQITRAGSQGWLDESAWDWFKSESLV
jgi:hypothetical protein